MPKVHLVLAASLAIGLAAAGAQAQATSAPPQTDTSVAPSGQSAAPSTAPAEGVTSADTSGAAPTIVGGPIPAGASNVQYVHVASPPVPDTPENRAKYGAPMSNGGRHTKAAGD